MRIKETYKHLALYLSDLPTILCFSHYPDKMVENLLIENLIRPMKLYKNIENFDEEHELI